MSDGQCRRFVALSTRSHQFFFDGTHEKHKRNTKMSPQPEQDTSDLEEPPLPQEGLDSEDVSMNDGLVKP